jgi:hypothetical protein
MTTVVRGFAKFVVIKKPATKARKGVNPFTKEPTVAVRTDTEYGDGVQGEAGSEDHQGSPGKGCQRRGIVASKTSMEYDGQRRAMEHAPTLK